MNEEMEWELAQKAEFNVWVKVVKLLEKPHKRSFYYIDDACNIQI